LSTFLDNTSRKNYKFVVAIATLLDFFNTMWYKDITQEYTLFLLQVFACGRWLEWNGS
jgi:hypothetical protein